MNNGRLIITSYKQAVYCEACLNDEWSVEDLQTLVEEVRKNFSIPADIIVNKCGSYSVSVEAQSILTSGIPEFRRVVYVADNPTKRKSAEFAKSSYMKPYDVNLANTLEEAYVILKDH